MAKILRNKPKASIAPTPSHLQASKPAKTPSLTAPAVATSSTAASDSFTATQRNPFASSSGPSASAPSAGGQSQGQLLDATKQMQETQMSFNLQYLQLQSQMQHENRSYTAVSNIMKTKHDTVKNSISNVR